MAAQAAAAPSVSEVDEIATIFASMNVEIRIQEVEKRGHLFELYIRDERIGVCYISIVAEDTVMDYRKKKENVKVLKVIDLLIYEGYQGRGLGQLLLCYGLCFEHALHPDIQFSVLDDASDKSQSVSGNIYEKLGYVYVNVPTTVVQRGNEKVWQLNGPERQLRLGPAFLAKVRGVIEKYKSGSASRFGKKHKRHSRLHKKSKSKNKKYFRKQKSYYRK